MRLEALNDRQRQAVDTIDGPLMVIAGPGTGKTELLSMRVANILQKTDTLPENILCLTYTDSGVSAMRRRLAEIIGPAAYKVAVHTFHSFSTEVINHNRKFFYNGATFRPADELHRFEILQAIFEDLPQSNPLSARMNGEFTHLKDALAVISELKSSGLTSVELLNVLDANNEVIDIAEKILRPVFSKRISKATIGALESAHASLQTPNQPAVVPGIPSLAEMLQTSLGFVLADATAAGSTTPITAWKSAWFKKDEAGELILKARERQIKLRAMSTVYDQFMNRMSEAGLFDFDDMILNTIHAMETAPELRFNLQEKYLYIMVDEFQDTNLAQMRILRNLTENEVNEGRPNLMVVGDDDQAIYGFQGATVGNIHSFITQLPNAPRIVLTDNYRSVEDVLGHARSVITQGHDRLEYLLPGLDKSLKAHILPTASTGVRLVELPSSVDERSFITAEITSDIKAGHPPQQIAILARRHQELIDMLPYCIDAGLPVNYERRDNVLELDSIRLMERIADTLIALLDGQHEKACGMLPELLAHPAFAINPNSLWQLSIRAQNEHKSWLEIMPLLPEFALIHSWLITQAQAAAHTPLERMCDIIMGVPGTTPNEEHYVSPVYHYFFAPEKLATDPLAYLTHLNGLIAIRARLREYYPETIPTLRTLLDFLYLQRKSGGTITSIQPAMENSSHAINLMTAHKAKGLEFDRVYIIGATDSTWGEKARSRSRLINYPENLPLSPVGDTPDDRLRLFYVAMTRAKKNLTISYGTSDDNGKTQLAASFLTDGSWRPEMPNTSHTPADTLRTAELSWYQPITRPITPSMRELLAPRLERYKLNATHLSNFLDLTRGGPETFIIKDLLRFPQAPTPVASYGRAIHTALQKAHSFTVVTGEQRPHEDILRDFETALEAQYLPPKEHEQYLGRGSIALQAFLNSGQAEFLPNQKTELHFGGQGVVIGGAELTGILDVLELTGSEARITDYKTGKATHDWKGKTDYEKIKLHRYKTQLLFYDLLVSESRDFAKYSVEKCSIQFVEPTRSGDNITLEATFTDDERERLKKLIQAVWQRIVTLDMPDTSDFEPTYKGMLAFEDWLIDTL